MIDLTGRVALVTGGSRGIGLACVEAFVALGAKVGFTWNSDGIAAAEVVTEMREADAVCESVPLALGQGNSAREAVSAIRERLGPIDVLVNNAGIWNRTPSSVAELHDEELDRMLDVNLKGAMQVTREACRDMIERRFGRIISIGSTAGVRGEGGHSHYAASKGALLAWSRSLTVELGPYGVTANVVSPGWVETDMTRSTLDAETRQAIEAGIPTRRITRPEEIAATVMFLASPGAAQISGCNVDVNGGAVFS